MAQVADIIARVRRELGDHEQPFRDTFSGTGFANSSGSATSGSDGSDYDLTETQITSITVDAVDSVGITRLVEPTHYTVDRVEGRIYLFGAYNPLPIGTTLLVNGTTSGMFTDEELTGYTNDAFLQHAADRTVSRRMRTPEGYISFVDYPMQLEDLPRAENQLLALLVEIECLWALTTDASTDIDITTADGTHVARSQRYTQMRAQIDILTEKYEGLCEQLNVGIRKIEMFTLRRVSRTTGRLVPIYKEREFDDMTLPQRLLPPIDARDLDDSGIPSPAWAGYY
jgi:hypothetical protein